jgi:hypothetical protein
LLTLRPNDLLLDRTYRRLWVSILISSFAGSTSPAVEYCGGPLRIIASLTDPAVLERILTARGGAEVYGPARGPPQGERALG